MVLRLRLLRLGLLHRCRLHLHLRLAGGRHLHLRGFAAAALLARFAFTHFGPLLVHALLFYALLLRALLLGPLLFHALLFHALLLYTLLFHALLFKALLFKALLSKSRLLPLLQSLFLTQVLARIEVLLLDAWRLRLQLDLRWSRLQLRWLLRGRGDLRAALLLVAHIAPAPGIVLVRLLRLT